MANAVIFQVLLLIGFSFVLIKSCDLLVRSLNKLSRSLKIGAFAITSFLLAFATSLPELFVAITAGLGKKPNLALGVILGSNIANISLVIGGAALISGSLTVVGEFLKRDIFYAFLAASLPLVLLLDNKLSRAEGLMLLFVYGVYNYTVLRGKQKMLILENEGSVVAKILQRLNHKQTEKNIAWLFLGVALLIFSADMIVRLAGQIAAAFNIPIFLIGLFVVAVGATLPELSFEIKAIRLKKTAMVFGNLLGSIVVNSTLVIGLSALINPIVLNGGIRPYLLATLAFLIIFNLFWLFVKTKRRLERWEGLVLLLAYILFVAIEIWRAGAGPSEILMMEPR